MAEKFDIIGLTNALLDGAFENPLWKTFLGLLRDVTASEFATLVFQPPGWRHDEALHLVSGFDDVSESLNVYKKHFYQVDPVRRENMLDGRPYTLANLLEFDNGAHESFYQELTGDFRITDVRQVRVCESSGVDAWLSVIRQGGNFDRGTDAILAAIAPLLRGVLRIYMAGERKRYAASMAEEVNGRLQFGWLALDRAGTVVGADRFAEEILSSSGVLWRNRSGRLGILSPDAEREVLQAIAKMATGEQCRPRAIPLSSDPWLDMLLAPARERTFGVTGEPVAVAYVHGDNWRVADRCGQLVDLFSLSRSEARLALALCRGRSLAEAAEELGLRIETARSYSKAIYSKTGARGMHDLVRVIMGSVLALAPEPVEPATNPIRAWKRKGEALT